MNAKQSLNTPTAIAAGAKRIVVLGAYGRLGQTFVDHFGRDHTVIPLDRDHIALGSAESIERVLYFCFCNRSLSFHVCLLVCDNN